jgi:hypothetical protein
LARAIRRVAGRSRLSEKLTTKQFLVFSFQLGNQF